MRENPVMAFPIKKGINTELMKVWFTGGPERLKSMAYINAFTKSRKGSLMFGCDDSTHKIGRQTSKNWCGSVLAEIKVPWTGGVFNTDRLRTILKTTFILMILDELFPIPDFT